MVLQWLKADRTHAQALEQFVCTDPPKWQYERHRGKFHPRVWELEAQSHLRQLRLPVPDHEGVILGIDDSGVVAAIHFGFEEEQSHFMVWAVAAATRCHGKGFGRRALTYAMRVMEHTKKAHGQDAAVFTRIDPRNESSRRLFEAHGFEYLCQYEGGYENWIHDLPT